MSRPAVISAFAVFLLSLTPADSTSAQVRASERGGVWQRVDGTDITIEYSRPQARGRENLFGGVVHHGELWTPGANWATTLEVSKDVMVGGEDLPAGTYSMWMVTGEEEWRLHLSPKADRFHTQRPPEEEFILSVPVTPEDGEHFEVLSFHFPEVRRDGTTLHFHWGTTLVALDIDVHPSASAVAFTPEEIAPYLGFYDLTMYGEGDQSWDFQAELIDARGRLRVLVDDGEWSFELVRSQEPNTFYVGWLDEGEIFDIEETPVHFDLHGDEVTGFTAAGISVEVWMRAVRNN